MGLFAVLFHTHRAVGAEPPVPGAQGGSPPAVELYMPDGQLKSHLIRVYVNVDIPRKEMVKLTLHRLGSNVGRDQESVDAGSPVELSRHVVWNRPATKEEKARNLTFVQGTGTLLLFDLNDKISSFASLGVLRVYPVLSWTKEGNPSTGQQRELTTAISEESITMGNGLISALWAFVLVGTCVGTIAGTTKARTGSYFAFLKEPEEIVVGGEKKTVTHLSLWIVQLLIWTLAISGMVLAISLNRSAEVEVPAQLLVLMGLSLTTSGVAAVAKVPTQPSAGFLLVRNTQTGEAEFSIAKAQMLIWTLLTVSLFVFKSWINGALWEVPWMLVAMMGFSQAGYLAPKVAGSKPGANDVTK